MPEIGYGHQRGGIKQLVSRWDIRLATCLITNAHYSAKETVCNARLPKDHVNVIYHGVEDVFRTPPMQSRERMALTVGNVDRPNLWRKGLEPFVRAAALLPDVKFVLVGAWLDCAIDRLRAISTPNVTFAGRVDDAMLRDFYQRASVYVQPSAHEGFGLSVAEAMLAGCIPVVTRMGALPEVVGDAGLYATSQEPADLAEKVQEALAQPNGNRLRARNRILTHFPVEARRTAFCRLIEELGSADSKSRLGRSVQTAATGESSRLPYMIRATSQTSPPGASTLIANSEICAIQDLRPEHVGKIARNSCWLAFALAAILFVFRNPFPSLYGDEYGSLREAENWALNPHAIGYFVQLHFWRKLGDSDLFLRSLSLVWLILGLYWLHRWLLREQISLRAIHLTMVLAALNPYLWKYGTQIRFYTVFFAAAILTMWRFRVRQQEPRLRNTAWLALSSVLLCSAHLFGFLVLAVLLSTALWARPSRSRWVLYAAAAGVFLVLLVPSVSQACTALVYALTNRYANLPRSGMRGLTPATLVKIPFTFFVFVLGERVYPLWWWISVPAVGISGLALWNGLRLLKRQEIGALASFTLISVVGVFLVLDPIAPFTLQGAAPRYVIYALPVILVLIALGAERHAWMRLGVIAAEVAGLACLFWPVWSSDSDLMKWSEYLRRAKSKPNLVCIITDGRALAAAERYAAGSRIFTREVQPQLSSCPTVLLASNDYRLEMTRWLDGMADSMQSQYKLISNTSLFPAQISIYEKSDDVKTFAPSRMGLPEQDLQTPLSILMERATIEGFVRLDKDRPSATVPLPPTVSSFWIATNFRSNQLLPPGTPVMGLRFHGQGRKTTELTLRAGFETAPWDGSCSLCKPLGAWSKRVHILGARSYPGAYRQYDAIIWGTRSTPIAIPATLAEIRLLLERGTVYFFGFYSSSGITQQ
jgi:hypothetical protein